MENKYNADLVIGCSAWNHSHVAEGVSPGSVTGSRFFEGVTIKTERIITVWCIEENLPFIGLNATSFECVEVG